MTDKWKYIGSSAIPLTLSIILARNTRQIPYSKELGRTLIMVSGSTLANRIITAIISPDLEAWKKAKNRYSTQVSVSTSVGVASSIIGSVYDGANLETSSINLAIATLGSWTIGNLLWLNDATMLGESITLQPDDFVPDFYV